MTGHRHDHRPRHGHGVGHGHVLALALVLGGSCTDSRPGPAPEAGAEGEPSPELQRALSEAIVARAAAEAAAANADAYISDLKKYDRIFEGLEVYRRVPERWDAEGFRKALAAHLARHRLKLGAFEARERAEERRKLPETAPARDGFRYQPADLRAVVDLRFTVSPADAARIRAWFDDRAGLGPFLLLTAVKRVGTGYEARGETYAFLPQAWPRYTTEAPDLAMALQKAGVHEPLAALRAGPAAAVLREIEAEYAAMTAARPRIEVGLQQIAESQFREARYNFFKERTAAIERQALDDLLK